MGQVLQSLIVVGVGLAATGAVVVVDRARPELFRRRLPSVRRTVVAAAALGAAAAPPTPTGLDAIDLIYRVLFAVVVTLAAGRARRHARLIAGAAAAIGSAGAWPWNLVAFAALGLATGSAAIRRPARPINVLIGGLQVQVLLRLTWPDQSYGTAALAAVAAIALVVSGVRHARRHERRAARLFLGAAATAGVLVAGVVAFGLLSIRPDLTSGARAANAGLAAARAADAEGAVAQLNLAHRRLGAADDDLRAPWLQPGRLLPVVGRYLGAGQHLTRASIEVLTPALRSAELADGDALRIEAARVDLDAVARLQPPLRQTLAAVPDARVALADLASEALPGSLSREIHRFDRALEQAVEEGSTAASALELVPQLLGGAGPRRWFVVMQTPAEQRASGGFAGAYGVLRVDDGQLELEHAGTVHELRPTGTEERRLSPSVAAAYARFAGAGPDIYFGNVTQVPDFPTVGQAITELYPQAAGASVDGVISVDPTVLAALLSLTGPIEIPSWPEPLTAENAERILLHEQYVELEGVIANQFLVDTIEATFTELQGGELPPPAEVIHALAPAVQANHLLLYSADPAEQALFTEMGVSGAVPEVAGDSFQLVTQNSGQSKIDWFQRRSVAYDVRHDPVTGRVDAVAIVTITNDAPATGLPSEVIGGSNIEEPGPAGRSRLYVEFHSALDLDAATIDGQAVGLEHDRAFGRNVYWTGYILASGETVTFELFLSGLVEPAAPYELYLGMQPVVTPDAVTVSMRAVGDDEVTSSEFTQRSPRWFRVAAEP